MCTSFFLYSLHSASDELYSLLLFLTNIESTMWKMKIYFKTALIVKSMVQWFVWFVFQIEHSSNKDQISQRKEINLPVIFHSNCVMNIFFALFLL